MRSVCKTGWVARTSRAMTTGVGEALSLTPSFFRLPRRRRGVLGGIDVEIDHADAALFQDADALLDRRAHVGVFGHCQRRTRSLRPFS
jgi:hypothetical protein